MTIPHTQAIAGELTRLLFDQPDQVMHCESVYPALAARFAPMLSYAELNVPYANSRSKWANEVQWAVDRMRRSGQLRPVHESGRAFWQLTEHATRAHADRSTDGDDMLRELLAA